MKTHYELLGIAPSAEPEDVKRAFRKEIARYHPDKVQHLGPEFQEIASSRAAALTEAYRTLMDAELRRRYDESLAETPPVHAPRPPAPAHADPPAPVSPPTSDADVPRPPRVDRQFAREQASTSEFVRRAVLAKLNEAVSAQGGTVVPGSAFDAMFHIRGRKAFFRKPEPTIRVAVKVASIVDAPSVEEAWGAAMRLPAAGETVCLMLLGSGIAPARELAQAVSDLRRRHRATPPVVVPVDMRDWSALLPPETPTAVRTLLDQLRQGN